MTRQRHSQSLGYSKEELNRLNQAIQRLTVDVDRAESQPGELEGALQEEGASGSAKVKLAWLEAALQRSRQDMARQLREYQELMVVKLGLDFEIATCRKLLEGEERRLGLRRGAESLTLDSDLTCPPGLARGPDRLLPSGEEHSWLQRLTLRLPRPCQGIQLQRLPRTLNTSSPAPRTLAFAPKTWSSVSDAPPMDLALASFLPRVPHPGPQSLSLAL